MTFVDFTQALEWLTDRYGPLGPAWKKPDHIYDDLERYTAGALREACYEWYQRGEAFPPKPSQLAAAVRQVAASRQERGEDPVAVAPCTRHVWALAGSTEPEPRVDMCARCHTERPARPCDHVWGPVGCLYCPAKPPDSPPSRETGGRGPRATPLDSRHPAM